MPSFACLGLDEHVSVTILVTLQACPERVIQEVS